MRSRVTNQVRAVTSPDHKGAIDDAVEEAVTIAQLAMRVQALEQRRTETSKLVYWLLGILAAACMSIAGVAYSAHDAVANRLIEVSRETGERLASIDQRLKAQEDLIRLVVDNRLKLDCGP